MPVCWFAVAARAGKHPSSGLRQGPPVIADPGGPTGGTIALEKPSLF